MSRRGDDQSSDSSARFGDDVGDRLASVYGRRACWVCGVPAVEPHRSHVFPRKDANFAALRELRLVHLRSPGDFENVVPLCPNCHGYFDNMYRPQLFIVPTYLEYFFSVEQEWQHDYRTKGPRTRISPTYDSYLAHCEELDPQPGKVVNRARGGLYARYVEEGSFPIGSPEPFSHWHGDPMAMLYRAIQGAERNAMPQSLPRPLKQQLMHLHLLYEEGNELQMQMFLPPPSGRAQPSALVLHLPSGSGSSGDSAAHAPGPQHAAPYPPTTSFTSPTAKGFHTSAATAPSDNLPRVSTPPRLPTPAHTASPGDSRKRQHDLLEDPTAESTTGQEPPSKRVRSGDRLTFSALRIHTSAQGCVDMVSRYLDETAIEPLFDEQVRERDAGIKPRTADPAVDSVPACLGITSVMSNKPSSSESVVVAANWWGNLLEYAGMTAQEAIEQNRIKYLKLESNPQPPVFQISRLQSCGGGRGHDAVLGGGGVRAMVT